MWVHWLKNRVITFNLHDKLFYSVATIVVFNNGAATYCSISWLFFFLWNIIESFRYLPESIYNYSAVQNSLVGDLSRPASSATAFTIDFQKAFENSKYISASLHESSNGKDPGDSLISSPLLQEYIATQNIQQETEGTNFNGSFNKSTTLYHTT